MDKPLFSIPFSQAEQSFLSRICVAMQNPVDVETVKMWLMEATAEGLDPRRIYTAAVACRPPHWDPAPAYESLFL
ncbi:hypothetical protein YTPLAS18_29530 [Nitrospira sp.]|nr:hypothetical protein YTPLAS18_29530 [Nitrospira sp.]